MPIPRGFKSKEEYAAYMCGYRERQTVDVIAIGLRLRELEMRNKQLKRMVLLPA